MKKGNLIVLCILCFALIVSGLYVFMQKKNHASDSLAQITVFGKVKETIDLNTVTSPYDLKIENNKGGYNIIHVENGKIRVIEANCPDGLCIKRGDVMPGGAPAVCIPNGVVVEVTGSNANSLDTFSQ